MGRQQPQWRHVGKMGAGLDPGKFVYGLARAVKRNGGQIFEKAEVKRIDQRNGRFSLSTEVGEVQAGDVLIATNGYTTILILKIRYGIFSGACYTIVTEPLSPEMQEIISPNGRVFYDSRYFLNYSCVLADGRMLNGGRKTIAHGQNLEISARELKERLVEIFPQLKDIKVTHC